MRTTIPSFKLLGSLVLLIVLCAADSSLAVNIPAVQTIRVPNGGIHPQAAVDTRGRIHLVYFKGDAASGDALYVRSDDGGKSFTKPLQVNSVGASVIVAGTVRGPHVAMGRGDRVHVAWMGSSKSAPKAGRLAPLLYTRLNDAGDAFEPQRDVSAAHPGLDGGGSVAADADGNVYIAWHAPADHAKEEGEIGRHVWVARSLDDGRTFAPEVAANPKPTGVCACCGMRVFAGEKGRVFVLYRSAEEMVNRDVQLLVSTDFGRGFAIAAADPWKVSKCVMSTAAFAKDSQGGVLAVWEAKEKIRMGRVAAGAVTASDPVTAPGEGKNRKHPSIAINASGQVLLAWTEETSWNKGGSIVWQVYDATARPIESETGRQTGLPAWGVPAALALPDARFVVIY